MAEAFRRLAEGQLVFVPQAQTDFETEPPPFDMESWEEQLGGVKEVTESSPKPPEAAPEIPEYTTVLVIVITYADTDISKNFEGTVTSYLQLLRETYPKPYGIIDVVGAKAGSKEIDRELWPWLSQSEFLDALSAARAKAAANKEIAGFEGYKHIHIIGHGTEADGLYFKTDTGADVGFVATDVGDSVRALVPVTPGGKVFLMGCDSDEGPLKEWLVGGLEVEEPGLPTYAGPEGEGVAAPATVTRVRGVEGYFGVGTWNGEPVWEGHPSTRMVADALNIVLEEEKVKHFEAIGQ